MRLIDADALIALQMAIAESRDADQVDRYTASAVAAAVQAAPTIDLKALGEQALENLKHKEQTND